MVHVFADELNGKCCKRNKWLANNNSRQERKYRRWKMEEAVEIAKTNYNKTIYAGVSDNAPVMTAMGKAVNLWHAGCSSHHGNLLAKDLIDKSFAESINTILRTFKASNLEREIIENGGTKIKLACETRWCSYRDAFRCCLKNLDMMKKIINFIVLSDSVCSLINKCQQSNFTIPDAAEEWMKLNVPIEDEKIQEIVQKRIDKVLTPILLAANLLHPHYQGKQFRHNDKYYSQAIEFIRNELNESYHEMEAYENKVGIFESLLKKGNIPPKLFWQMAENSYPVLSQLAQRLINIPSSSAQIERLFSNWSFVHSCLRNRLTPERSEKIMIS
ncbi:Protein of unknown function [Cotesia congregata]|uniref:HAT C-terminal dimerisation domain-containing protein n=1 Tax=Cotesia congregata TaxID=51543 RepID=A0A8J2H974_COTCN|nr:Protein of unknown function [Cotesia congregata]